MTTGATTADIARALAPLERIALVSHQNPDGDAIGSILGLASILEGLGKSVACVNVHGVPEHLRWLPGWERVVTAIPPGISWEAIVLLDCSEVERTGLPPESFAGARLLVLDHHPRPAPAGPDEHIDPTAPATGSLAFALATELGQTPDAKAAQALYTSIITDTGDFRYANATPEAFETAASLVRLGASPAKTAQALHENERPERLRLLARALSTLTLSAGGRVADITVTLAMMDETGTGGEDTDGFVNYPRSLRGVEVAILWKERADGSFRAAMRSRGIVDVSVIARANDGGGHRAAAGATFAAPLEEARASVVSAVMAALAPEGGAK